MSRTYRILPPELWARPQFRALTAAQQHLYLMLWTHPALTTAGTLDYNPRRLAPLTADLEFEHVDVTVQELEHAGLIVVDRDTEELAILTWWEDTTTLRQPYVTKNAIDRLRATASTRINQAVAERLHALNVVPVPGGLLTDAATRYLADYPSFNPAPKSPVLPKVERLPDRVWPGHPLVVEFAEDARCALHAGGPAGVGCVECGVAVRVARERG
ncbi:hypothetical protein [Corynebacterium coyleae]|uniref:hypothetical protein n=1 Tax=Corynebacterium coyleae TaxID=53374 RepID=UPI002550B7CF|nr:hypothetical protein [Corynebacterium coyleae]MDK8242151.1 hypothetical protein [Corynebacterium coyleae]